MSTNSQSRLFLLEALDLIGNTTVAGVLYGITFTLYCLCARSLYLQQVHDPDKRGQVRFTLGYVSTIFLCTTAMLVPGVRIIQLAYIDHADFPGGPFNYEESYNSTTNSNETATSVFSLIVEVLTMAIQIWRLWVIWSGTRYAVVITVLPVLLLLSFIALEIPIDIIAGFLPLDQLGISDHSGQVMEAASYACLSGVTITVTGLVAARILVVRRRCVKISDTSGPYLSIIAMLIESYTLEAVWSIATAISNFLNNPSSALLSAGDPTIKAISYFLVVYRVSTGRGWTTETGRKLTSLQWNHDVRTTADQISGVHSQVPATIPVVAVRPPTISLSESAV